MIISISGTPGSGKTTVGKEIAKALGMPFYSIGDLRGKMAMERGVTIDELNTIGEQDASTDTPIDDYQKALGEKEDNFVVEGRLSWLFIPHSLKVYLDCDPSEAARRIFLECQTGGSKRQDENICQTQEAVKTGIENRVASDVKRYDAIYHVDYRDPAHYDIVFDTTAILDPQQVADEVLKKIKEHGA
ncbi:MAG: cytidylate kinase family protein [bacterium]|nr:cytidylate kinase family protein [bacterium]